MAAMHLSTAMSSLRMAFSPDAAGPAHSAGAASCWGTQPLIRSNIESMYSGDGFVKFVTAAIALSSSLRGPSVLALRSSLFPVVLTAAVQKRR